MNLLLLSEPGISAQALNLNERCLSSVHSSISDNGSLHSLSPLE